MKFEEPKKDEELPRAKTSYFNWISREHWESVMTPRPQGPPVGRYNPIFIPVYRWDCLRIYLDQNQIWSFKILIRIIQEGSFLRIKVYLDGINRLLKTNIGVMLMTKSKKFNKKNLKLQWNPLKHDSGVHLPLWPI